MFYNKAYLQIQMNTTSTTYLTRIIIIIDYTGGCFRLGIRSVHIGVLSSLTSSLEIIVSGEDFISVTLLASSNTFVLFVFMASISAEERKNGCNYKKDKISLTHNNIRIINHRTIFI